MICFHPCFYFLHHSPSNKSCFVLSVASLKWLPILGLKWGCWAVALKYWFVLAFFRPVPSFFASFDFEARRGALGLLFFSPESQSAGASISVGVGRAVAPSCPLKLGPKLHPRLQWQWVPLLIGARANFAQAALGLGPGQNVFGKGGGGLVSSSKTKFSPLAPRISPLLEAVFTWPILSLFPPFHSSISFLLHHHHP